jgi:DNA-binding transcriptional MerR regulator
MPANAIETIAGLSRASGVDEETLRAYQAQGLLPAPRRIPGRHGAVGYQAEHLERLWFIGRALQLGFSLELVPDLLGLDGALRTCGDMKVIARRTVDSFRARAAVLPRQLEDLLHECEASTGSAADCPILRELRASAR